MNTGAAVFHLSHRDCEKLRETLQAKSDAALDAKAYAAHDIYQEAIRQLHKARMEAFENRSTKRGAKRRRSLDAAGCTDR